MAPGKSHRKGIDGHVLDRGQGEGVAGNHHLATRSVLSEVRQFQCSIEHQAQQYDPSLP